VITQIPMTMQIEPVEIGGQHFVNVSMNGRAMKKRGPFSSAAKAKAEADRIIREWTPALPAPTNDTVVLNGVTTKLDSNAGRKFVVDCTRAGEKLVSDSELQQIYDISPENWAKLEKNTTLIKAIRDERKRRVRNGQAAKEAAAQHFVKAPTVLDSIMSDSRASARHRIEAAREIRQVAVGGDSTESHVDASERFIININLGADEQIKIEVPPEDIRRNTNKQIEGTIDAGE
jgi:hypothetical protein